MTVQQVNLYTTEFRPVKDPLALRNMLLILGVVWLAGLGYTGWIHWEMQQSQNQLSDSERQNKLLEGQVAVLETKLAARAKDKFLQIENNKLRLQLVNTQGLLEAIADGLDEGGNRIAFTSILVALARHQLEPLWLSQIKILTGGERVVLAGATLQPEKVPHYLRALGQENAFSGRSFNEFSLEMSAEQGDGQRQFIVDTQAENEGEVDNDAKNSATQSGIGPVSRYLYHKPSKKIWFAGPGMLAFAKVRARAIYSWRHRGFAGAVML